MIRENRYLVAKLEDVRNGLTPTEQRILWALVDRVNQYRAGKGKGINEYVVVAKDWPMYENVWKQIEEWEDVPQPTMKQYMKDLAYNLDGVIIDVEEGPGFDQTCLNTVHKVCRALHRYPEIDKDMLSRSLADLIEDENAQIRLT